MSNDREDKHAVGTNTLVDMLVDVALIRERYGTMRKQVDEVMLFVEAAKTERTWYKGYAAATIGLCTLIVTGVTWAANNHVIQKVDELVNRRPPVSVIQQQGPTVKP